MSLLEHMNIKSEVPESLSDDYRETCKILEDYLMWIKFSALNTSRDPDYNKIHLLSFLEQDII